MPSVDQWVLLCFTGLAGWVLVSGLDDLFLNLAFLVRCMTRRREPDPSEADLTQAPRQRIAILIPLWQEAEVVGRMISHNIAAIGYDRYSIFIGVYPNDPETRRAVEQLEQAYSHVHLAAAPHEGPTSKADCLNWIFLHMQLHEERHGARFDLILIHDAEDLIHPESLWWANYYSRGAAMVQIPVLPLPTPPLELVHGVYCDEFATFQIKELPARQFLGGFLPSCGVGTAFRRDALERLAVCNQNRVFDPRCLTEDYEIGFRLHRLGYGSRFIPIRLAQGGVLATREYFPRSFRAAVRQRTRWMTGIALQSWELHGWRETARHLYWFWRDRKGLVGSLASPAINLFFIYSLAWHWTGVTALPPAPWLVAAFWTTLALQAVEVALKALCTARIYGWCFASALPLRIVTGNCVNFVAACWAIARYAAARIRCIPLVWLKTDHLYPGRAALVQHKRRLGEILAGSGYVTECDLEAALLAKPVGVRLGEYLVGLGKLTEGELYEALSLQHGLAMATLSGRWIAPAIARALPAAIARKWKVVPFAVSSGRLLVAGPEILSDQTLAQLRRYCSLEVQFHWITPTQYRAFQKDSIVSDAVTTPSEPFRA